VLGAIAAGTPQEAIEETDTWVERLDELLAIRPGDFLLTVKGESMIGEGIFPGDLVLIRPQERVAQGEIAAVRVGADEATLKRVYVEPPNVRLTPANPAMSDMIYAGDEVRVLGRFEGLIRLGTSHRRR
jgi:repressor LexA